jgi:hypothetical protein
MQMKNGQTFSVRTDMEVPQRVCYMQLDITAQAGDSLTFYLTGRSGTRFDLTVGKNSATDTYQVEWTGENDSWHCKWYGVKATSSRVTSLDFVNTGNHTITLDNLFFAGVNGICNEAGDYATFSKALTDYETNFVTTEYREQDVKTVMQTVIQAKKLTAYSSQERLDSALQALSSAIASAQQKADLTALNGILTEATAFMQDRESSVQKSSWLIFQNAYLVATQITDENSQQEVDEASENLQIALTDVQTQAQNNSQNQSSDSSVVTLSVVGGSAVGLSSLVAVGAFLLKRRVV